MKPMGTMRKNNNMAIIIRNGGFWVICSTKNKNGVADEAGTLKSLRRRWVLGSVPEDGD
ncbi:MAG: hypothetical protein H6Q42_566 [Deltaproteobacteria bacterium]|nr:hypothetical protein [Deltaproteobacteria bacterium]